MEKNAITKTQANYIIFLEDTYRKLNSEKPTNANSEIINSKDDEGQFFITIGTKNMSKSLDEAENSENKTSLETVLVDPSKKNELMREKNIELEEDDLDDFIDLTEIL